MNTTPARPQRAFPAPTVSTCAATGCAGAQTSSAERAQRQLLERIARDKSSPTPPHQQAATSIPLSNRYEALTLLSGSESDYADDRADEILLTSAVRPIAKGKHAFAGKRKSTRMPRALAKRMDSHQPRLFSIMVRLPYEPVRWRKAMVDNGSIENLISISLIPLEDMVPIKMELSAANGTPFRVIGKIELPLGVEDRVVTVPLLVRDYPAGHLDILLGSRFLEKSRSVVSYFDQCLTFLDDDNTWAFADRVEKPAVQKYTQITASETAPLNMSPIDCIPISCAADIYTCHKTAYASETVTFGPHEEKLVRFHVHPHSLDEGALFLAKPLYNAPSLFMLDTYFDADSPLEIWVTNASDDYVSVLAGDKLGLLEAQTPPLYALSNRQWCNLLRRSESTVTPKANSTDRPLRKKDFNFGSDLTDAETDMIFQCLLKHQKVFASGEGPLTISNVLEASIELKDPNVATFNNRTYVDEAMGDICEAVLRNECKKGVLKETTQHSNFRIPFLLVPKRADAAYRVPPVARPAGCSNETLTKLRSCPDEVAKIADQWRLVIDAKELNKNLQDLQFHAPRRENIFAAVRKSEFLSSADLAQAYFQLSIKKVHRHRLRIAYRDKMYDFCRLPMGIKTAPAYLNYALFLALTKPHEGSGRYWMNWLAYCDDCLCYSKSGGLTGHIEILDQMLTLLENANFQIKASKCNFGFKSLLFLGCRISGKYVSADLSRVRDLQRLLFPMHEKLEQHTPIFPTIGNF